MRAWRRFRRRSVTVIVIAAWGPIKGGFSQRTSLCKMTLLPTVNRLVVSQDAQHTSVSSMSGVLRVVVC